MRSARSAASAVTAGSRGVSFLEKLWAADAKLVVSGALISTHRALRARSIDMVARSRRLLASSPVFWIVPPSREDARVVENARARELDAVIAGTAARCSHSGCGAAPIYRAHVVAAIGENELVVEPLSIRVCGLHRAELEAILGDLRVLRLIREKLEARKGTAVPIRSLRAVFRAERRSSHV